jgi:hypothetical protein
MAIFAPHAHASLEVQFYQTEEFNLTYALPVDWMADEIPVQDNAFLLGFYMPDDDEHSMIFFCIPKEGELEEDLLDVLRAQAESVFAGAWDEDTVYRSLTVDGMPAIDARETDFSHQALYVDDIDRYLILIYQSPVFFDEPGYLFALETFVNSVGLLKNEHPYESRESDYLVVPYEDSKA